MATIGNNIQKEMAFVRDCFFDSKEEQKINEKITSDPSKNPMKNIIDIACKGDAQKYFEIAQNYINDVEEGKYPDEQMVLVEKIINYCLGKIEDIHPEQTQEPCFDEECKVDQSQLVSDNTHGRVIEDPQLYPWCKDDENYDEYLQESSVVIEDPVL